MHAYVIIAGLGADLALPFPQRNTGAYFTLSIHRLRG